MCEYPMHAFNLLEGILAMGGLSPLSSRCPRAILDGVGKCQRCRFMVMAVPLKIPLLMLFLTVGSSLLGILLSKFLKVPIIIPTWRSLATRKMSLRLPCFTKENLNLLLWLLLGSQHPRAEAYAPVFAVPTILLNVVRNGSLSKPLMTSRPSISLVSKHVSVSFQ
ncbi:hypothetical protein Hanom_Chr03g00207861 [Helianthus anomalus]